MKFCALLLCVAFIAAPVAVSGKNEQQSKSSAPMPVVKPTAAPLMTSTAAPTKAPKVNAAPTKATKTNNGNKKKTEAKPTEKTPMANGDMMKVVVKPVDIPATVVPMKSGEMMDSKGKVIKPVAVTGFITQNGNIYEIDDKETGMGKIEGRQNAPYEVKEHVCNYGSVVVYSDLPCEDVVTTENRKPLRPKEEPQEEMKPQEEGAAVEDNQNNDTDMDKEKDKDQDIDKEDLDGLKPSRRPNSKKPRNKNKKLRQQQKNRRNKNRRNNRPNKRQGQYQYQNQRRSQQELEWEQRRRRQQQKRRRAQLEEQEYRRQNQRRRNRGGNRRQPVYMDDYDDDY